MGTTGVHHTLVAAHMFIKRGKHKKYKMIEGFDDGKLEKSGRPFLVSDDGRGNQVYCVGVGKDIQLAKRAMTQFLDINGFTSSDLFIQPVHIKGDKLLLWLVRLPEYRWLKALRNGVAECLIRVQLALVQQSVRNVEANCPAEAGRPTGP
jgi:hypothetical protein